MPNTESGAGVERTRLVKAAPPEMFRPAALTVRQGYFWVQVAGLVRPWWRLLAVAAVLVAGSAVARVVPPLVIRQVVQQNLLPHRPSGLALAGLLYLAALAAGAALTFGYSYLTAIVAQRIVVSIRVRLMSHLAQVPIAYFDATPTGEIVSHATSDVETIDALFTDGVATLVGQLVSLVAVGAAMVVVSPLLSAVALIVTPPLWAISHFLQLRVRRAERQTRAEVGGLNTELSEMVGGAETIRAYGREANFVERFRQALVRTLDAQAGSVRYNAFFTPVTGLLAALVIAAILWVGAGGPVRQTEVSLGTLIAFVLLFQNFFAPITALGDQWNRVQAALSGLERIFDVFKLPVEDRTDSRPVPHGGPGIVVRDLRFGYVGGAEVLKGIGLTVNPGERVAIVGRTGSGKSTLVALLGGLYRPQQGTVLVDGLCPFELEERERRQLVGYVPQSAELFSASLRTNVTFDDRQFTDGAIRQALSLVGLGSWLEDLPEGLDTRLAGEGGGRGLNLSAGQRQLIALARAVLVEPRVLLLDEATSALDRASDAAFQLALQHAAWASNCAIVTVTHRLATASGADRVVVLDQGAVVEEGSPSTLLENGGWLAALAAIEEAGWDPAGPDGEP